MADYVLIRKSRNIVGSFVYVFLNLLLGVSAVLVTVLSGNPFVGLLLVLVSKWRTFSVRLRYLWPNLKLNLVDLIVGFSVVLLAYSAGAAFLPVHFLLIGFYVLWLLVIKPLSSEKAILIQSLIAGFFGISAASLVFAAADTFFVVLLAFVIGYSASRHILTQNNDKDFTLTTLVCGVLFAEVSWLCSSWFIVYSLGETGVRVPQLAIILTVFLYVYDSARQTMIKYQDDFRLSQIAGPIVFGVLLIGVVVLFFSKPIFNI